MKRQRKTGAFWAFVVVLFALIAASSFVILSCDLLAGDEGEPFTLPDSKYRIYIDPSAPTEFRVDGKRIWINGANTPWNQFDEFGSTSNWNQYDNTWWKTEFGRLKAANINATRVWISCRNETNAINIDTNGKVTGVSQKFWNEVDKLFELAAQNEIYILATLISFNHFETRNKDNSQTYPTGDKWQKMIKSKDNVKSFADNYTIPFVKRYNDNPYLWSIDICNELDWVYENAECGKVPLNDISYFVAYNAAAIHANSDVLVTFGGAMPKYDTDKGGFKNYFTDSYLKSQYNNSNAYIDFWSPHYYDWVKGSFTFLNNTAIYYQSPNNYGMDNSKPSIIGECPAKGSQGKTTTQDYEGAYNNGWQGAMAWTSNGVDDAGSLTQLSPATKNMKSKYPKLIYPLD